MFVNYAELLLPSNSSVCIAWSLDSYSQAHKIRLCFLSFFKNKEKQTNKKKTHHKTLTETDECYGWPFHLCRSHFYPVCWLLSLTEDLSRVAAGDQADGQVFKRTGINQPVFHCQQNWEKDWKSSCFPIYKQYLRFLSPHFHGSECKW